jgi:hypothetical protein
MLRRGAWWSSSQQTVGLPWGRQAVLPLEMAPPFNNKQRLFRLILDGVPFVFLLAVRGSSAWFCSEQGWSCCSSMRGHFFCEGSPLSRSSTPASSRPWQVR